MAQQKVKVTTLHAGTKVSNRVATAHSQAGTWKTWVVSTTLRPLYPRKRLTYSIEQIPSIEADRFSASQEIPRIL